jgi:pimeloyl-ACP methyl ester carboxylesterase
VPHADLNDVQLHYREHGEGGPVLGIMGFGLDQRYWAAQVPAVTATNRFITFDNRGVGRSTGEAPTSIEQMADDSVRLLDFLEIDRAVIFGVSMGGAIAQRLVLSHPDRVAALILGITWARPIEFMRRQHDLARTIIQHEGPDGLLQASLIRMFTPQFFEIGQESIDRMIASFTATGGPEIASSDVLSAQLDALDKHDTIAALGTIEVPTLVFGGRMDVMVPGFASEEIARAIPGAELQMFETGHGCMIEEMEGVNALITRFLASLKKAPVT